MVSSASAVIEKVGLFSKVKMNLFGGWNPLSKKDKKKKEKLASTSRLKSFAREFQGKLMLEPLEERIVPASVLVGPGEYVLTNFSEPGHDGATYGIIANAGPGDTDNVVENGESWFAVDITPGATAAEVDTLDAIHLATFPVAPVGTFPDFILTNIRVPLVDDDFVDAGQTVNATLVTGVAFGTTSDGLHVTFGGKTFTLADDFDGSGGGTFVAGNFTEIDGSDGAAFKLDKFEEVNGHASDVGAVDADTKGTVNFVEVAAIGSANDSDPNIAGNQPWAGIDTRISDKDMGDVGVLGDISISGSLGTTTIDAKNVVTGSTVGIWAHDGSILRSSTGLNFESTTPTPGSIEAQNIGDLKAALFIGSGTLSSITAGDGAADAPTEINERIGTVVAGRDIFLSTIAADDGIHQIISGSSLADGTISVVTIDGNADRVTNTNDIGIDLIRAVNGAIFFNTITTDDDGDNDDLDIDNNPATVDPLDLPQNRPTSIDRIEALNPNTPSYPWADIQGISIRSDANLGPVVSGFVSDPFTNSFGEFGFSGIIGSIINVANIVAEGDGDLIMAPGGVSANIAFWRATTSSPLLNVWSGRDTNGDGHSDTGIIYRVEALKTDGTPADDVTAAIDFIITTAGWSNPDLTILNLNMHAGGATGNVNTVIDSQTDLKITTREIVTETLEELDIDSNEELIAFAQTVATNALQDSAELIDVQGIDVDGAPPFGPPFPAANSDGDRETDLRNLLIEGNLDDGAVIDLDYGLPNPNEPDNIGDLTYLFVTGTVGTGVSINVESLQAYGGSYLAEPGLVAALTGNVTNVLSTEAQDLTIIAQRDLPDDGGSTIAFSPGVFLRYNTGTAGFPRAFTDPVADYNNELFIGAPSLGAAIENAMAHVHLDFIDGNDNGKIEVHELATAITLPASPGSAAGDGFQLGTLMGASPIPSVENSGPADVALITTAPDGGAIGFIEWEGDVGAVVTVDNPDPTHTDLPGGYNDLTAFLGTLSVGVSIGTPLFDDDAFTTPVVRTSDLGYADVDGDIGWAYAGGFGVIPDPGTVTSAIVINGNLQGVFVTGSILGTLGATDTAAGIAIRTEDTVPPITSHGELIDSGDYPFLNSVIAFDDILGHILVGESKPGAPAADGGNIVDNIFAGYDGSGTLGTAAKPIIIRAYGSIGDGVDQTATFLNAFEFMHAAGAGNDYVGGAEGVYAQIRALHGNLAANVVSGWDIISPTGTIFASGSITGDILAGRHIIADISAGVNITGTIASGLVSSNSATFPPGPGIIDTMFNPPTDPDSNPETEENNSIATADPLELQESSAYVMNNVSTPEIDSVFGTLFSAADIDYYSFVVDPAHIGQTIYAVVIGNRNDAGASATFDPFLELRDPNGTLIASSDNDSLGLDPVLAVTLEASGTYYLGVGAATVGPATFDYTLDTFLLPASKLFVGSILPYSGSTISAGGNITGNIVAGQTAAPADAGAPGIVFGDYNPINGVFTATPPNNFEGSVGDILNPISIGGTISSAIVAVGGSILRVDGGSIVNSNITAYSYAGRGGNIGDPSAGAADVGGIHATSGSIRARDGNEAPNQSVLDITTPGGLFVNAASRDMIIAASSSITEITAATDIRAGDGKAGEKGGDVYIVASGGPITKIDAVSGNLRAGDGGAAAAEDGGFLSILSAGALTTVHAGNDLRAGNGGSFAGADGGLVRITAASIGLIDVDHDLRAGDGGKDTGSGGGAGGGVTIGATTSITMIDVGNDLRAGDGGGGVAGGAGGGFSISAGTAIGTINVGRDLRAGDGGSIGGGLEIIEGKDVVISNLGALQAKFGDVLTKSGLPADDVTLLLQIKAAFEAGRGAGSPEAAEGEQGASSVAGLEELALMLYEYLVPGDVQEGLMFPFDNIMRLLAPASPDQADTLGPYWVQNILGESFFNVLAHVASGGTDNNGSGGSDLIDGNGGSPPYFRPDLAEDIWNIIECAVHDSAAGLPESVGALVAGSFLAGSDGLGSDGQSGNTITLINVGRDLRAGDGAISGGGAGGSLGIASGTTIKEIRVGRDLRAGLNNSGTGGNVSIQAGANVESISAGDDILGFSPGIGPFTGGYLTVASFTGGIGVINAEDQIMDLRAFSFGKFAAETTVNVFNFSSNAMETVVIPAGTGIGYITSEGDADRQETSAPFPLDAVQVGRGIDVDPLLDPSPVDPDGDFPYTPLPPNPGQGFHGIDNLIAIATGTNATIIRVAAENGNIDPTLIFNLSGPIGAVVAASDITDTFIIAGDTVGLVQAGDDIGGEDPYANGIPDTVILSGLDSLIPLLADGVGGIGSVRAGDEVRDTLVIALEKLAGSATAITEVVAGGLGSTVPSPDFPDYYPGPFGPVSTLHGIDTALIIGNGNIGLVDAQVGNIIWTGIAAYGSSIGRIHAGNDIGGDLFFSGVFAPVIAIATDHIREVAAGDDINTYVALSDFTFGLRDKASEDDTIGGIGIVEAGDSIEATFLIAEGHFTGETTVSGLDTSATVTLPNETSIGNVSALGLADTNLDSIDTGSIFIFAAVADGKIGEIYSYDNISFFVIHSDNGASDPVTQFNPLGPLSWMTGDDFFNNVDNAETTGGGLEGLVAEHGNIAFGEVLVIKGNIGDDDATTADIFAGQSIINVPIAALKAGPLPFSGGEIGIIQTYEDFINPEVFAGKSLAGIRVGRDLIDGDPFIDIESEDIAGDIGFLEVGRDITNPFGYSLLYELPGPDLFFMKSDFGSIGLVTVGRNIDGMGINVFAAYKDFTGIIAGGTVDETFVFAMTGDLDILSAASLNVVAFAGGVEVDSPLFTARSGGSTYTIDVSGAFDEATLFFFAGQPGPFNFGANPDVALLGVTGTDNTSKIDFNTTGAALWDVIGVDVDPYFNETLLSTLGGVGFIFFNLEDFDIADFFSPTLGFNLPIAPDDVFEANLLELRIEGNLGVKDGTLANNPLLPGVIDFDDGMVPDNKGDVGYIFIENEPVIFGPFKPTIQTESLGIFGTGLDALIGFPPTAATASILTNAAAPTFSIAELVFPGTTEFDTNNVTNVTGPITVTDRPGDSTDVFALDFDGASAYYFTTNAASQYGDAFYVMARDPATAPEARGTVSYVKASDPVYPVGDVNFGSTPIAAFFSTRGVHSVEAGTLSENNSNSAVVAALGSIGGVKINGNVEGALLPAIDPAMILAFGGDLGMVSGVTVTGYVSNSFIAAVGGSTENLIFLLTGGTGTPATDAYFLARAPIGKGGNVGDVTVGGQVYTSAIIALDGDLAASSSTITIGGDLDQSILLATKDVGNVKIGQDMEYSAILSLAGSIGDVEVGGFMWFDLIAAVGGLLDYVQDVVDRVPFPEILLPIFGLPSIALDPFMDAYVASLNIDPSASNDVGNIKVGQYMDFVAITALWGDVGSFDVGGDMTHTAIVASGSVAAGNSIHVGDDMFQVVIFAGGGAIGDVTVDGYMEDSILVALGALIDPAIDLLDDYLHELISFFGIDLIDSHLDSYIQPSSSEDAGDIGQVTVGRYMLDDYLFAGKDIKGIKTGEYFAFSDAIAFRDIGPVDIGEDMAFAYIEAGRNITSLAIGSGPLGGDMYNAVATAGNDIGAFSVGTYCNIPATSDMDDSELWAGHSIASVAVNGDIYESDIVAFTGSIGPVSVGDDIESGDEYETNIFAEAGIGAIVVQDSILGDVEIVAISGNIGDITVGGNVNKNPGDVDGDGIFGFGTPSGGGDGVKILAQQSIGNITVTAGHIQGNVMISAGVSPEVSGVDWVFSIPEVVFPSTPDMLRDFTNDVPFSYAADPPALFLGNIGNVDVQAGGIFATGSQALIISATGNIGMNADGTPGYFKTGSLIALADGMSASAANLAVQAGGSMGAVTIGGSVSAYANSIDFQAGGKINGMVIKGSMINNVDVHAGSLAGIAVAGDMNGNYKTYTGDGIDIKTGEISEITYSGLTAAILVGRSMLNDVNVLASKIGSGGNALTVGFAGTGDVNPGAKTISIVAQGAGGNIGNITVRDQLGTQSGAIFPAPPPPASQDVGDVKIISQDGSVGDIVAGKIYVSSGITGIFGVPVPTVAKVYVTAETAIGDIVAMDDPLTGIKGLVLTVSSPFGRIGDIITHGNLTAADISSFIDLNTFDGSIGDLVSLVGYVQLGGITFGGSIGDIYGSESVTIEDVTLEAGSLADDGTIGTNDASLKADQKVIVKDGLGRDRYDGAPNDGITSEIGDVDIDNLRVGKNVGPITAFAGEIDVDDIVVVGNVGAITAFKDVTLDNIEVGGNMGNITSTNASVLIAAYEIGIDEFHVVGNVGDISAFLRVEIGTDWNIVDDVPIEVQIGGNVGNISALAGVAIEDTQIGGNILDITGSSIDSDGVYMDDVVVGGTIGNITGVSQDDQGVYIHNIVAGGIGNITGTAQENGEAVNLHDATIGVGGLGNITGTAQGSMAVDISHIKVSGSVGDITGNSVMRDGVYMDDVVVDGFIGNILGVSQNDEGVYLVDTVVGESVGTITGISDKGTGVYIEKVKVIGNVGDITGNSVMQDGVYMDDVVVDGFIGNILGVSQNGDGVDLDDLLVGLAVGDITGSSVEGAGVFLYNVNIVSGGLGTVIGSSALADGVAFERVSIGGSTGNITGSSTLGAGVHLFMGVLIQGNVGNITGSSVDGVGVWLEEKSTSGVTILGNVGNITGISQDAQGVELFGVKIGGSVGDITGNSQAEVGVCLENVTIDGSVGDVKGFSQAEDGVSFYGVNIGGSVASISGSAQDDDGVELEDVLVGGSITGGITGSSNESNGVELNDLSVVGSVGDITALAGDIEVDNNPVLVGGNVGNVTAVIGSIYTDKDVPFVAHGNIGNIVASGEISAGFIAESGNIGNITSYASDIYHSYFGAGNDIGDVVALQGSILGTEIHATHSIGDVYASKDIVPIYGCHGSDMIITAETGDIGDGTVFVGNETTPRANLPGGVVSAVGDILATIHAGQDIYNVWAMKPSFTEPTDPLSLIPGGNILDGTRITAGHDIGSFVGGRGVIAGGVIEDDIAIIAGNNIGVVEAKIIGFGFEQVTTIVTHVVPWQTVTVVHDPITIIKIQVPDNDGRLDMNDYLMFTDSNGDDVIDVPWELAQAIAGVDSEHKGESGYVPILTDCKLSNPEFDLIVDWLGRHPDIYPDLPDDLPSLPDWYNAGVFRFGEVEVEDVDNIITFELAGYFDQFDANKDGRPDGIFKDKDGDYKYDPGEEVTFNYDVPNLPLVFIDHITTDRAIVNSGNTYIYDTVYGEPPALLSIIAQGPDQKDAQGNIIARAIGAVGSLDGQVVKTHDIYANVLIEATAGGIGSVMAANNIGAEGSLESITFRAQTAIDKIFAGNFIGRPDVRLYIDVMGSGPGDIITLGQLQGNVDGWMANNGVGVNGGIIAGAGNIYMDIDSGASIGAIQANAGGVYGSYHATGNIKSVYGSLGVDGGFVAELGKMDFVFAATGGITGSFTVGKDLNLIQSVNGDIDANFTVGGTLGSVSVTKGDIEGEIIAVEGVGVVSAPFGNVSGKIWSGGNIGEIVESPGAAEGDVSIMLKLVGGDSAFISSLGTAFAMEGDGFALIQTDDSFDVGGIVIRQSSGDTDFFITGKRLSLDKFLVYGDLGSLTDNKGGGADASIQTAVINGDLFGTFAVDGDLGTLTITGDAQTVKAANIGTASIGGSVFDSFTARAINTLAIGGDLDGTLNVTKEIGDLSIGGDAQTVKAGDIGTAWVGGSVFDSFTATSINTLGIGGDLDGTLNVTKKIGDLSIGGDAQTVKAGEIGTAVIGGAILGSVSADSIGSISVGEIGPDGSLSSGVASGHTFTYNVSGTTDSVNVVGGNWLVSVLADNVIDATLTKVTGSSLALTTTSSVEDLSAKLSGRPLDLNIGGSVLGTLAVTGGDLDLDVSGDIASYGKVELHSGNLTLEVDDILGDVTVTAGSIEALTVHGKLAGDVSADALADGVIPVSIGGDLSGSLTTLGDMNASIGGDVSGTLDTGSGELDLNVGGDIAQSGEVKLHSGNLTLEVDDILGDVTVTAGFIDALTVHGKLAGEVTADAIADHLMVYTIGGDLSGVLCVLGALDLSVGGDLSGTVSSNTLFLDVAGDVAEGAEIDGKILEFHVGGSVDPSIGAHHLLNTKLDDDPLTAGVQNTIPDHITLGTGQIISVVGSSDSLTADVLVIADSAVSFTTITGRGGLSFSSTGILGRSDAGTISVAPGASIGVNSIYVDGNFGGFVNTNNGAVAQNIKVSGNVDRIEAYGMVQNVEVGGWIGEISSLWKDVKNIVAKGDIDSIFARNNVLNVTAGGDIGEIKTLLKDVKKISAGGNIDRIIGVNVNTVKAGGYIGEIIASKSIKVISAHDIGLLDASDKGVIQNVTASGDIDEINARNVTKVYAGGRLNVNAAISATGISSGIPITDPVNNLFPGGIVEVGQSYNNISPNIQVIVR